MVERTVVALRIVLDRNLPVAALGDLDPFQRLEAGDVRNKVREFLAHLPGNHSSIGRASGSRLTKMKP
jgi:hypothetical protein